MKTFSVKQQGNRVELHGGDEVIFYDVSGVDLPPLTNHAFAVWHILAHALAQGYDFVIDGPVDAVTLENARKMSRVWEMWEPHNFREIEIHATADAIAPPVRDAEISLFSAGVDSTHMFLKRGRMATPSYALTVHGMDYGHDRQEPFDALLEMSRPLLEALNFRRIVIRSNANLIAKGYHAWGMVLAGHAFLLSNLFNRGVFAADFNWEQDVITFPWGQNHVTNRYFQGRDFCLGSTCHDVTRTEKLPLIASDPVALHTVSFCKDLSSRPRNCGICSKCIRTKTMFIAMTGTIPDIFTDNSFERSMLKVLKSKRRVEVAFTLDTYQQAKARGHLDKIPGLQAWIDRLRQPVAPPS